VRAAAGFVKEDFKLRGAEGYAEKLARFLSALSGGRS
jgi:hypothetical protein